MSCRVTTEIFIRESQEVHKSKYDYSLSVYVAAKKKVKIICPIHGIFEQTPYAHRKRGSGCKACAQQYLATLYKSSTEDFIKSANLTHEVKYDYSNVDYVNAHTEVSIICPTHGEFFQKPDVHLRGANCPKCTRHSVSELTFIKDCSLLHNYKYDYSKVRYENSQSTIKIICPVHGEYLQKACYHIQGRGCRDCGKASANPVGFINKRYLGRNQDTLEKEISKLYILEMCRDNTTVFKAGVSKNLWSRVNDLKRAGFTVRVWATFNASTYATYILEMHLHSLLKPLRYLFKDNEKFGGHTECYKMSEDLVTDLINYIISIEELECPT